MPKGVNDQFLRILDNERRTAIRHAAWGAVTALVLWFMANLADAPMFGRETGVYAATLVLGVGFGLAWGWWRGERMGESLKTGWSAWMRMSAGSATVDEVYRKARNARPASPTARAVAATALALANAVLFALLWVEHPAAVAFAVALVAVNGSVVGAWLGRTAFRYGWARRFNRALEELMRDGVIGIWGER